MWTRTSISHCFSLLPLRRRSLVGIGELGLSSLTRQNRRGGSCSSFEQSSPSFPPKLFAGRPSCVGTVSNGKEEQCDFKGGKCERTRQAPRANTSFGPHCESDSLPHGSLPQTIIPAHYSSSFISILSRSEYQRRIVSHSYQEHAGFALAYGVWRGKSRISRKPNAATVRLFSTSEDSPKKGKDTSLENQHTEPDFAEYLTSADQKHSGQESPILDATAPTQSTAEAPINLEGTEVPLDDHTEAYSYIRRRQQTGWKNAREKTSANVRRALAGNVAICAAKLAAYMSSGSSSMFSEFIHSVVDCGNQSLLLLGLRDAGNRADRRHPYGYGKSIYFYALVSALGTFFLGAGVSGTQAWAEFMEPSLHEITWQVWSVLVFSFTVDGYVLARTISGIRDEMPKDYKGSFSHHVRSIRDPATLAVVLEDGAACLGIAIATTGIAATSSTGLPVFDGCAGLAISGLLASMGLVLVRINQRFLLGQAVDHEITNGIERILLSQRSIDGVHSIQSQWTGPDTFSFKAEVDFDGTYLAAMLMPKYEREFLKVGDKLDQELRVLLSWYAEDVMRTVEREVRKVEADIRKSYPGAEFIELEPMSKDADQFAIDDGVRAQLKRVEIEALNRYLRSLYVRKKAKPGDKEEPGNKNPTPNQ